MAIESPHDNIYAAQLVGGLWAATYSANGPRPATLEYKHFPGLFDPAWLASLPLPIGEQLPDSQSIALGGEGLSFERPASSENLRQAYADQPRTRIYESIDARSGGWPAVATRHLMKLADCRVTCTMYESSRDDETLGAHTDKWYGAVVQVLGAKAWRLGQDTENSQEDPTLITKAGDLLLLPTGLRHDVTTPEYSVHLGFAMITDESA